MPNHIQNRLHLSGPQEKITELLAYIATKDEKGNPIPMCFKKIVPMPEGLEVSCHSGIETWVQICTGQLDFKGMISNAAKGNSFGDAWQKNGFDNMINYMSTATAFECLTGDRGRTNVKDFSDEDFDTFVQVLKNYRKYGFMTWYQWSIKHWGTKWNAYSQPDSRDTTDTIYFQTAWSAPAMLMEKLSSLFPEVTLQFDYADEDSGSNAGRLTLKNGEIIKEDVPQSQSKEAYDIYFDLHPDSRNDWKLVGDKYEYIDEEETN